MRVRAFPETRNEPKKRVLLVPVLLVLGGLFLTTIELLRFIGAVLALTGVLTMFLVGMVYADLLAASKRTKDLIKARQARNIEASEDPIGEDPFVDTLHDEDNA